jgi:hypothetical protein
LDQSLFDRQAGVNWTGSPDVYDSDGKNVRYWLKHCNETGGLLKALKKIVHASTDLG